MDEIKFGQAMEKEFEKKEILEIGKAIEAAFGKVPARATEIRRLQLSNHRSNAFRRRSNSFRH